MKLNYLQQGQNRNFSKVSITNFPMRIVINSMESRIGYSITFTQKYKVESTTVERSNTKVLCYCIDVRIVGILILFCLSTVLMNIYFNYVLKDTSVHFKKSSLEEKE